MVKNYSTVAKVLRNIRGQIGWFLFCQVNCNWTITMTGRPVTMRTIDVEQLGAPRDGYIIGKHRVGWRALGRGWKLALR